MVTVAARRELVRFGRALGLPERRALRLAGMSSSVLRYQRRDDGNQPLRERIVDMAHRHRRYGYRMIHLRLRHEGWPVNVKRVRRLYRLENLMVRRRKRRSSTRRAPAAASAWRSQRSVVGRFCIRPPADDGRMSQRTRLVTRAFASRTRSRRPSQPKVVLINGQIRVVGGVVLQRMLPSVLYGFNFACKSRCIFRCGILASGSRFMMV